MNILGCFSSLGTMSEECFFCNRCQKTMKHQPSQTSMHSLFPLFFFSNQTLENKLIRRPLTPTRGKATKMKAFCRGFTAGFGIKYGQAAAARNRPVEQQHKCRFSLKKSAKSAHLIAFAIRRKDSCVLLSVDPLP